MIIELKNNEKIKLNDITPSNCCCFEIKNNDNENDIFCLNECVQYFQNGKLCYVLDNTSLKYDLVEEQDLISFITSKKEITSELFKKIVLRYMNKKAEEYLYKNLSEAISFCNSKIESWRNEAMCFSEWRDNCYLLLEKIIIEHETNKIPIKLNIEFFTSNVNFKNLNLSKPSRKLKIDQS